MTNDNCDRRLVVIDFRANTCARYVGRRCTDLAEIVSGITAEKVERLRTNPDSFQTAPPEAA